MTVALALEILELKDGATDQEIRAAYNRLMQKVHPDVGGSTFFAKQLNAARDMLLLQARLH
jgi:type IV secretion system protein VirD4